MTIDELEIANDPNHKVLKVLKILLNGRSLKHPANYGKVSLAKTTSRSYQCICLVNEKTGHIIGLDFSLEQFIKFANSIPDEEIDMHIANIVLTRNRKKRK